MIEIGKAALAFTLPDQDGNPVKLTALRGAPVVVVFYPKGRCPSAPGWQRPGVPSRSCHMPWVPR